MSGYQESRPEIHCKHFIYGYPYGTPKSNDLIIRDLYALSNNDDTKFADWVCYRLDPEMLLGNNKSDRDYKKDPWLEDHETLEPYPNDDYRDAHKQLKTDRGHFAPLGSFKGSPLLHETNYLSNISPQYSALNQGPWHNLELKIRSIVKSGSVLYIMTGPLYERNMPKLPHADEAHKIPSGYWKIVCCLKEGVLHCAAFAFEQESDIHMDFRKAATTVDEIEKRSGLDFFWLYPQENSLEASVDREFLKKFD